MIFSSPDPAAHPSVAGLVLALQRSSYAVEADLIGDRRIPPLLEDEHDLAAWRGRWVMAWDGVDLVGAIAWSDRGDHLDVAKVMVSPTAMRQGIASRLLGRAVAASAGRRVEVATGRDNTPAASLYLKHGFEPIADEQVPPGIWITQFRLEAGAGRAV